MTSLFGVLLLVTASLCSALMQVRGDEPGGGQASASSSSKGARTLDKLSGGEYIRGLGGRHLDKISGGELLRSADDAELLRSLVLPYALRGLSPSSLGSGPRRGLDKIGGGEYIRAPGALPHGALPAKRQAPFDSLSGLTFGGDHGGLHKRGYGHGEFDEIDHAGWPGFYKRNFDEIDRTGFEGFYKRSAREE
ncbi:uncharacterized protein LOC119390412 isoform X1 [Rhipicephalus sanguineus]|uniref:uncharacterized protein LOC119390412 isoform X1 n=1 Tax=Rhipicephalus sanguineus TaxID=34632 RepID=UPI001895DCB6|nr:uncharacterized protein LOC119390412 isoform X1 [Rhipicephalus sanguineus]